MTKAELLRELSDVPDDYVVCGVAPSGDYYALTSIETFSEGTKYFDEQDEPKEGKIVVL